MTTKFYKDGDVILRQGDPADYFYIVVDGHVIVKRRGDDPVCGKLYLTCAQIMYNLHLVFLTKA